MPDGSKGPSRDPDVPEVKDAPVQNKIATEQVPMRLITEV